MRLSIFLSLFCSASFGFAFAFGTSAEPDTKKKTARLQASPYFALAAGEGTAFEFHQDGWSVRFGAGGIDFANREGDRLRLRFPGSDQQAVPVGEERRRGVIHDYRGKDPSKWRRSQPTFGSLRYPQLYPGIDLVYRLEGSRLKSEFLVAVGADPALIFLEYESATGLEIDEQGALEITSATGGLREKAPEIYQEIEGKRRGMESRYQLEEGRVSFRLEAYDPNYPLTIDPELEFFLFIGGSNGPETAGGIGLDAAGNTFIAGTTFASDFPTSGSQQERQGQQDAFVLKLDGNTHEMLYSVLIGGVGVASDTVTDLAVDGAGNAFITGHTFDFSFPTTENAPQPRGGGGLDIFVAKFDPDGLLLLSTFLGGELNEFGGPIALDRRGNVYLAGSTSSTSFPTTPDAFQPLFGGGSADVVVVKLNNAADTLLFSSYLGGSEGDFPSDLALAVSGDAYLVGTTFSTGLATPGAFQETLSKPDGGEPDAFVARIGWASSSGSAATLQALTYLGGSGFESGLAIALNTLSQVSVSGSTNSPDLPLQDEIQENLSGPGDAYVGVLTLDLGALLFSTYIGGSQSESFDAIVALADGSFAAIGTSSSTDLDFRGIEEPGQSVGMTGSGVPIEASGESPAARIGLALIHYRSEAPKDLTEIEILVTFLAIFETPPDRTDPELGNTPVRTCCAVVGPSVFEEFSRQYQQSVQFAGDTREAFLSLRDDYRSGFVFESPIDLPDQFSTNLSAPLVGPPPCNDLSTPSQGTATVGARLGVPLHCVEGAIHDTDFFSAIGLHQPLHVSPHGAFGGTGLIAASQQP